MKLMSDILENMYKYEDFFCGFEYVCDIHRLISLVLNSSVHMHDFTLLIVGRLWV